MTNENLHQASVRGHVSHKSLRRSVHLAFKDSIRLRARTISVSPFGFTIMSPLQISKGKICEIAFDIPLDGKIRKVNAISAIRDCVCIGTEGFRTRLNYIQLDQHSRSAISDLMQYPY